MPSVQIHLFFIYIFVNDSADKLSTRSQFLFADTVALDFDGPIYLSDEIQLPINPVNEACQFP